MISKISAHDFSRRKLLKGLVASAATIGVTPWSLAAQGQLPASARNKAQHLILIELDGGNDGLNTVIPYAQSAYYKARPVLALGKDQVHKLDERMGLHPQLEPLMDIWREQQMQIVLGVGYANPNRSHFRSMDIWHSASSSDQYWENGWLANQFSQDTSAEGIAFGGDYGPLTGSVRSLVLDNPETFAKQARMIRPVSLETPNQALAHVLAVRHQITSALSDLKSVLDARQKRKKAKGSKLNKQLHTISDLIEHGIKVPVFRAKLKGFDTHFHQPNRHKALMRDLASSLASLQKRLVASGNWNNTLIMTYSEFGRRPAENGSRGTDHGTAAPLFMLGGRVKGGFSGAQPAFPSHQEKDFEYAVDFRQVYRTVADGWLGLNGKVDSLKDFSGLDIIRKA